jgi:hypothetical protein
VQNPLLAEVRHATRLNSNEKVSALVPHARRWVEQYRNGMAIRVECYAGYRSEQEPLAFWLGERRLVVRAVVDRSFAPTQRWFKVDADDGNMYVLRHDEASGDWEIAAYRGAAT